MLTTVAYAVTTYYVYIIIEWSQLAIFSLISACICLNEAFELIT